MPPVRRKRSHPDAWNLLLTRYTLRTGRAAATEASGCL